MNNYSVWVRVNIEDPIMDRYNIKAENVYEAIDKAKEKCFERFSKCIIKDDIEVILVQNECGEKIDFTVGRKE